MVITRLKGGLGNQMFQYAIGRSLSFHLNTDFRLDTDFYNNQPSDVTKRRYLLDCFNIQVTKAKNHELRKIRGIFFGSCIFVFENYIKEFLGIETYFSEKEVNVYDESVCGFGNDVYLDGYWQTEKYFLQIRSTLLTDFTLKDCASLAYLELFEKISSVNSISLHVRRGDYITNKSSRETMSTCPVEYYHKAIEMLNSKVLEPVYFVFSDDIGWCKKNLKIDQPVYFVEDNQNYEDLLLMRACKHNIIANSSFSWWGAWLNENPEKVVISPSRWFNNHLYNADDIVPKSWIKI